MSSYPNPYTRPQVLEYGQSSVLSRFMNNVYAWMCAGLATTAVVAWGLSTQKQALATVLSWPVIMILLIVQIGLAVTVANAVRRISTGVATALFLLYAALNGILFSSIFIIYSLPSIGLAFAITAGMFGGMSLIGFVTKTDLTSFRSFLYMGLFGIIIASIVNMFMHSPMLYWIVTYAAVFIFLGLTAYDTQKLKQLAYATENDPILASRLAVTGSLILYLDFINLFIYMLQILASSRRND